MAAPKGNQFWKLAPTHGRKPLYSDPQELLKDCLEYFEVTSKRTWDQQDWVGKDAIEVTRKHPAPFTIMSLCIFLGMTQDTWQEYRKKTKEFSAVCTYVDETIRTQKFEGASTGFFNHAIIARDLGLKDYTVTEIEDKRKSIDDLFPLEEDMDEKEN